MIFSCYIYSKELLNNWIKLHKKGNLEDERYEIRSIYHDFYHFYQFTTLIWVDGSDERDHDNDKKMMVDGVMVDVDYTIMNSRPILK